MRTVLAAAIYFAVVFGAGFVLGIVRVALLVPRLGERAAELLELPVMLCVVVLVARWRHRCTLDLGPARQLAVGGIALLFMITAELALGAVLQGRTPIEVVMAHDPVSGAFYGASLVVFALLPWWRAKQAAAAP